MFEVTFKIPNEGKRSLPLALIMKAEGLKPGVPDIFIPWPTPSHHGMFIEFKSKTNKLTKQQQDMFDKLTRRGYACQLCYTWIEAASAFTQYLNAN